MGWGFLGKLGKLALDFVPGGGVANDVIDAVGAGMSGASNAMTKNRSAQGDIELNKLKLGQNQEQNYFDSLLAKDKEQGANADSAFKKLLHMNYMASAPENRVQIPGIAGKYDRPISGVTPEQQAMAQDPTMRNALTSRANYTYDPYGGAVMNRTQDYSALDNTGKSSMLEKILGIGGDAMSAIGKIRQDQQNQSS